MDVRIHPSAHHHSILALLRAYTMARSVRWEGDKLTFSIDGLYIVVNHDVITINCPG